MVAQGALNQIVASVFNRVRPDSKLAASAAASIASPRLSMSRSNSRMGYAANGDGPSSEHLPAVNGTNGQHQDTQEHVGEKQSDVTVQEESRTSSDTLKPERGEDEADKEKPSPETLGESAESPTEPEGQNDTPSINVDNTEEAEKEEAAEKVSSQRQSMSL